MGKFASQEVFNLWFFSPDRKFKHFLNMRSFWFWAKSNNFYDFRRKCVPFPIFCSIICDFLGLKNAIFSVSKVNNLWSYRFCGTERCDIFDIYWPAAHSHQILIKIHLFLGTWWWSYLHLGLDEILHKKISTTCKKHFWRWKIYHIISAKCAASSGNNE